MIFAPPAVILGVLGGARFRKESLENPKMATTGLTPGLLYLALLARAFLYVLATNTQH
ncbi:hypothetical protein AB4068_15615 [Arthrobacter sp. 2RAF22]|uniref:hypothetical protein n=1 Tax=Arthrobacter sp. 2RAF22 TaxID=3232996 RepID=UPI003F91AE5C